MNNAINSINNTIIRNANINDLNTSREILAACGVRLSTEGGSIPLLVEWMFDARRACSSATPATAQAAAEHAFRLAQEARAEWFRLLELSTRPGLSRGVLETLSVAKNALAANAASAQDAATKLVPFEELIKLC